MKLTQARLGTALGISQASVSDLAKLGMPTDDIESARVWREANINPLRLKSGPPPLSVLLQRAESRIGRGKDITTLLPALRHALRGVPADQRPDIAMSVALWDVLTASIRPALACEPAALTTEEAEGMGAFWYAMAVGESWPAPTDPQRRG